VPGIVRFAALSQKTERFFIPFVNARNPDLALRNDRPGSSWTQRIGFWGLGVLEK
jgi:hypothetical protein